MIHLACGCNGLWLVVSVLQLWLRTNSSQRFRFWQRDIGIISPSWLYDKERCDLQRVVVMGMQIPLSLLQWATEEPSCARRLYITGKSMQPICSFEIRTQGGRKSLLGDNRCGGQINFVGDPKRGIGEEFRGNRYKCVNRVLGMQGIGQVLPFSSVLSI